MFNSQILIPGEKDRNNFESYFKPQIISEAFGLAQGNILSPIFCNIYLDKLDKQVESLILRYNKGIKSDYSKEYQKLIKLSTEELKLSNEKQSIIRHSKKKVAFNKGLRYTLVNDNFIRVKYVRYADDFIVGVRAPKNVVLKIKKEISFFLKSNLRLEINEEKTKTTNTYHGKARFLGMTIHNIIPAYQPGRYSQLKQKIIKNRNRAIGFIEAKFNQKARIFHDELLSNFRKEYREHSDKGSLPVMATNYTKAIQILLDYSKEESQKNTDIALPKKYQFLPFTLGNNIRSIHRELIKCLIHLVSADFLPKVNVFLEL